MQDNVTQADREAAGRVFRAIGRDQSARLAELGRGGDGPVTLILAAHRLASTAQPEVKGLVEALGQAQADAHMLRHAIEAKDPTAELLIRVSDIEDRLYTALAAYREAQP